MPWAQRDSSEALHLLAAARQGRMPQRRVERLALLQLLMQLHRQAHERTGAEPSTALSELQGQGGNAASNSEVPRRFLYCKRSTACRMNSLRRRSAHLRMEPGGAVCCCSC